jgi:hypothetical protein
VHMAAGLHVNNHSRCACSQQVTALRAACSAPGNRSPRIGWWQAQQTALVLNSSTRRSLQGQVRESSAALWLDTYLQARPVYGPTAPHTRPLSTSCSSSRWQGTILKNKSNVQPTGRRDF